MTVESTQAAEPGERGGAGPGLGAGRRRPGWRDAGVPLAVIALGCAVPVLGLLVLPGAACSGAPDGGSEVWCLIFIWWLTLTAVGLIAGGIAAALGPTVNRFVGGLGGLLVASLAAGVAWPTDWLPLFAIVGAVAFTVGYAVAGTFRWLAGTVIRKVGRTNG